MHKTCKLKTIITAENTKHLNFKKKDKYTHTAIMGGRFDIGQKI